MNLQQNLFRETTEHDAEKFPVLSKIHGPSDVKSLNEKDLDLLCSEIREKLIETVSSNGGHLASNLGTVELTVALHRSFDLPDDKIVWDVSHQAYTHKLLTGRFENFDTLRTENGISGFTRPDESIYDVSYEGHAGTSVSRAAGINAANIIKGSKSFSIAVIGDGSFGNGMVYEALNDAGSMGGRLIVILNDNEMSISESVGAMARRLAVVRSKPEYYRFKAGTEKALNHIPLVGKPLAKFIFRLKSTVKSIIYKSSFFEDLGFRYIGPVDGHDVSNLCSAIESAKMVNQPVLIHINTIKGKGYDFAEKTPEMYHGVSEFNVNEGTHTSDKTNYSEEFGSILTEFASKDKRICAVTAAMSIGTGLTSFFENYPERSHDAGIAEEHALTYCSGLAAGGMIPVFAVYSTFLQRCCDQIIHDGALQKKKMIIGIDRAGFVGQDGETHQGIFDVSLLNGIPNVTVYSPSTYEELSSSMYKALYKVENLVCIRYPRGSMPDFAENLSTGEDFDIIGESVCDTVFVTYGKEFFEVMKAVGDLAKKGHKINILKLNKIIPLDISAVHAVINARNIYFFEEGIKGGGVGEIFASSLIENGYRGRYHHIAVNNEFVPHSTVSRQFERYKLDSDSIINMIEKETGNE